MVTRVQFVQVALHPVRPYPHQRVDVTGPARRDKRGHPCVCPIVGIFCNQATGATYNGVLRFVGRAIRERGASANVVGVILDEPRDTEKFKSAKGFFGEVRVLDCPPGYGFVSTVATMEKSILRVVVDGNEKWFCHSCHHANGIPRIDSVMDYLELSLSQLDSLVRCEECLTVRVWHCPHATCCGLEPLEVADVGVPPESAAEKFRRQARRKPKRTITSMLETFTCPRCLRPPTEYWPCPQCDNINTGLHCVYCEYAGEPLLPQRDSVVFLLWLRNPVLELSSAWDLVLDPGVAADVEPVEAAPYPYPGAAPASSDRVTAIREQMRLREGGAGSRGHVAAAISRPTDASEASAGAGAGVGQDQLRDDVETKGDDGDTRMRRQFLQPKQRPSTAGPSPTPVDGGGGHRGYREVAPLW